MSLPGRHLEGARSFQERTSWAGTEPEATTTDPLLGTTLHDTYVVSRVLGEGGMGRVYEAHHTRIRSKRYAIKVLHSEFARDPDVRLRFQREAEAAATIEHDGVVGTYDVGKTPEGWPYMVCEYLAGEDLNDYLTQRGVLPAKTVVHIGKQLCSALRAAHARGVIHRDLKPHNVFVMRQYSNPLEETAMDTEFPAVKVLDFGLSRFMESDNELTKTGIIIGTPGYMSPEQANAHETDLRTDIYGIGALLYAAATGRPPFKEESPQLTVLAVMSREPPRPRELTPSIPGDLEVVIQKAMARDPNHRYQSASEMEAALSRLHAASPMDRRHSADGRAPLAPRLTLILYAGSALLLGGLSLAAAFFSVLEIKGIDYVHFRPTVLEWLLFGLLALFLALALSLFLRRFHRQIWSNSARVADLIPKIRRPLIAATLAYGFSSLVIHLAAKMLGIAAGLAQSDLISSTVSYVVLPINAALAASVVMVRDAFARTRNAFLRAMTTVGYSAGAWMAGLLFLAVPFAQQRWLSQSPASSPSVEHSVSSLDVKAPIERASAPSGKSPPASTQAEGSGERAAANPLTEAPNSTNDPSLRAPKEELAIAREEGAEALEKLLEKYPRDSHVLKALVLAHASRADTLDKSAQAIDRLLQEDPAAKDDPDVLFILKKALRTKGSARTVALATVKSRMGPDGAELVYQLMSELPKERDQLKPLFQELRKAQLASPAVLIAYDLRYAASCRARLSYLERAEKYGDVRSLQQLQALSTAPKRCGWARTCYPPCRNEAERFQQSAKVISERLSESAP